MLMYWLKLLNYLWLLVRTYFFQQLHDSPITHLQKNQPVQICLQFSSKKTEEDAWEEVEEVITSSSQSVP